MAKLKPYWTKESEVPEPIRAFTRKTEDGRVFLDVEASEDGWTLTDVSALERTINHTRKERDDTRAANLALKASLGGLDLEEAKAAIEKVRTLGDGARGKGEIERVLKEKDAEWTKKYETDIAAERAAAAKFRKALEAARVDDVIRQAAAKLDVVDPELLMPHARPGVRLVEQGEGNYRAQVVDEAGNPRLTRVSGSTGEMPVEEYIASFRSRWPVAFRGTRASGGGGAQGDVPGGTHGGAQIVADSARVMPEDILAGKVIRQGAAG